LVICVFLRMAASAEAPWSRIVLPSRLQGSEGWGGDGERVGVSMGIDKKMNAQGWRRTRAW
jgi:hypothetical protein